MKTISRSKWNYYYLLVIVWTVASLVAATAAFQVHQKKSSSVLSLSKKNDRIIWQHEQRVAARYLFQRIEDETIEEVKKERLSSRIGNRLSSLKTSTLLKLPSQNSTTNSMRSSAKKRKADNVAVWIQNVHELRREVLQNKIPLKVRLACACDFGIHTTFLDGFYLIHGRAETDSPFDLSLIRRNTVVFGQYPLTYYSAFSFKL